MQQSFVMIVIFRMCFSEKYALKKNYPYVSMTEGKQTESTNLPHIPITEFICVFLEWVSNYKSTCRECIAAVTKFPGTVFSLDNTHPDRSLAEATIMSPPFCPLSFSYSLVSDPSICLSVSAEPLMEPEVCLGISGSSRQRYQTTTSHLLENNKAHLCQSR